MPALSPSTLPLEILTEISIHVLQDTPYPNTLPSLYHALPHKDQKKHLLSLLNKHTPLTISPCEKKNTLPSLAPEVLDDITTVRVLYAGKEEFWYTIKSWYFRFEFEQTLYSRSEERQWRIWGAVEELAKLGGLEEVVVDIREVSGKGKRFEWALIMEELLTEKKLPPHLKKITLQLTKPTPQIAPVANMYPNQPTEPTTESTKNECSPTGAGIRLMDSVLGEGNEGVLISRDGHEEWVWELNRSDGDGESC